MGKLILCSGREAERPYHFSLTDTNVYTAEELCYYLYNNIYSLTEEDFDQTLVDWLKNEVDLAELSDKLDKLISNKNGLKDIVVSLLCGTDYYTEIEIKELIRIMDEISHMPPAKRLKMKGDNYLKYRNYVSAAAVYDSILKGKEAEEFTPEEYGNILHDKAVARLHSASIKEAAECFQEAYAGNHNPESLKEYLTALYLGKNEVLFIQEAENYQVDRQTLEEIVSEIRIKQVEAEESEPFKELQSIRGMKESGKISEYYSAMDSLINRWKQEFRKEIG